MHLIYLMGRVTVIIVFLMLLIAQTLMAANINGSNTQYPMMYAAVSVSVPFNPSIGNFPAAIIDTNNNIRTELYLGDTFFLFFDLSQYSGQQLYVTVYLDGSLVAAGNVNGGYAYLVGPFEEVEPIYEGKVYTFTIYVYNAATGSLVGSSTASYVEKYCPDFQIENINYNSVIQGNATTVRLTIGNLGEETWTYKVEIWSTGGDLQYVSQDVTVGAKSTATVSITVPVVSFQQTSDTMVVRISCAGGQKYNNWTYPITVLPPRPGPIVAQVQPITARLGQTTSFTLTLKNMGYDAKILSITLNSGSYNVQAPAEIGTFSQAPVTVSFTPTSAGIYNMVLTVSYTSPTGGEVYQDNITIPVQVYAMLAVNAVDNLGNPVQVTTVIAGNATNEAWLLPGVYTVDVPSTIQLSDNERLTFARWSTGQTSTEITVNLEDNTVLTAIYNREYKIELNLSPALQSTTVWARAGDVFTYNVPTYVNISQDARWALDGFLLNGAELGQTLSFTVTGPAVVSAIWHKEYKITVDCGAVPCFNGTSQRSWWVKEGWTFSVSLPSVVQTGQRERWVLNGSSPISFTVTGPETLTPSYVKEYYVQFGYVIKTAEGVGSPNVVYGEWIPDNSVVSINADKLEPSVGPGIKLVLAGYEKDGAPASAQITVTGPDDVYVMWDEYYFVNVTTPVGTAQGGGWYEAGSTAVVSIGQTSAGFLVVDRFKEWVTDDGRTFQSPTVTLKVDRPMTITAVWEKDYTQSVALAGGLGAFGLAFWKREAIVRTFTQSKTKRVELEEVEEATHTWSKEEEEEKEKGT